MSIGAALCAVGCHSDTTGPGSAARNQFLLFAVNHHAITLALTPPYDTITLTTTIRSATNVAFVDTGTTTYTVANADTSVKVSSTGVVTAVAPEAGIVVYVRHTMANLTLLDSALINVNAVASVPVFTTFALSAQPGDTARSNPDWQHFTLSPPYLVPLVTDQFGQAIPDVRVHYTTSNANVVDPSVLDGGGHFMGLSIPGHATITAEATVYGVTKTAAVNYTVGWPRLNAVVVFPTISRATLKTIGNFSPHEDTVAAGGLIVWLNQSGVPVDVVFDSPPGAVQAVDSAQFINSVFAYNGPGKFIPAQAGGDIPAFTATPAYAADTAYNDWNGYDLMRVDTLTPVRARQFPTAGRYPYHSALYGTTGVIHVLPAFQVP